MKTKDTLPSCSNSEARQMQQIQDKAKKSCMVSFRHLYLHLKRLSQNELQGSRTESGFKCTFATLSGQDTKTFTGTMFLNVEQLEKQLDKEDFQEIGSMVALIRIESKEQDIRSKSGNDTHDDDADIIPIYDEEPMAERLSQNELQGSRTESGFKCTFATLSGQDTKTFTGTMFLNVEQLEKQLDKEDFQEIGSMVALMYSRYSFRCSSHHGFT
nr:hypothetical protein [Tanacetum cinerariifolium]